MPISIQETTVTPSASGDVVQLHISDMPPNAEGATFRLILHAKLPPFETPLFVQVQREAMKIAQDALSGILQNLATEIGNSGQYRGGLDPRPKR